jgi:hypothetical protein
MSPKRYYLSTELHRDTSQKTEIILIQIGLGPAVLQKHVDCEISGPQDGDYEFLCSGT